MPKEWQNDIQKVWSEEHTRFSEVTQGWPCYIFQVKVSEHMLALNRNYFSTLMLTANISGLMEL